MHALSALKHSALEALDVDDDTPSDLVLLHSLTDPHTVLEMVRIAETRITDEEIQALHDLIAEMAEYIKLKAPGLATDDLLCARQRVGLTSE